MIGLRAQAQTGAVAEQRVASRTYARERVPWFRSHYNMTTDPHRTIVTGSSAGGLGAAFVALRRPDLFGKVSSQSGDFWRGVAGSIGEPYGWPATQYRATPRRDVLFLFDVGDRQRLPDNLVAITRASATP